MAIIDLYAPDFPHGSQAGFERGCHGNAECNNFGSPDLVTCREAQIARAGDYNLRKRPLAEILTRAEVWPDLAASEAKTAAKPRLPLPTEPMPAVNAEATSPSTAKDDHDAVSVSPAAVVPAAGIDPSEQPKRGVKLPIDHPNFPHGTTAGFSRGCKAEATCPGNAAGVTCRQASRDYQREYAARNYGRGRPDHPAEPTDVSDDAQKSYDPISGVELVDAYPNPAIDQEKVAGTAAELLRELRHSEGRELHEADPDQADEIATERAELIDDVIDAIDDLTQARNELAKAKALLDDISSAHTAVVAERDNLAGERDNLAGERDNLAGELATVRRANTSLATSIHDLEVEKASWIANGEKQLGNLGDVEISKDVTAPPGVHVTVTIHVGSN